MILELLYDISNPVIWNVPKKSRMLVFVLECLLSTGLDHPFSKCGWRFQGGPQDSPGGHQGQIFFIYLNQSNVSQQIESEAERRI